MLQKQAAQGGEVGLVVDCEWAEPFSDKVEDQIAAQRRIDFQLGWYVAVHIPNATCENLSNIVYLLHLLEFFFSNIRNNTECMMYLALSYIMYPHLFGSVFLRCMMPAD